MAKHHGKGLSERLSAGKAQFEKLHGSGATASKEASSSPAKEGVPSPKNRSKPPIAPVIQPSAPPRQAPGGMADDMTSSDSDSDYE